MDRTQDNSVTLGLFVLVLGAVTIGLAAPLVKLSEMGPQAIGFWRMALAIPAALVWMAFDRNPPVSARTPKGWKKWAYLALPGLLFAGDLASWHAGIKITTAANATFLANLQPVFVVLGAWLLFGERISRRFLVAAGLAVGGAALMSSANISIAPERLAGDGLSMLTAIWYGGYILAVRQARSFASTGTVIAWTTMVSAPVLLIVALSFGEDLLPPALADWWPLAALAFGVQIVGQGGVAFGLGRVPAQIASLVILVQPVVATIAGWLMFGETLIALQYLGAGLVLTGVYLAQRRSRPAATHPLADPGKDG